MRDQLRRLLEPPAPRRQKDWERGVYFVLHRRHRKILDQHLSSEKCKICGTDE
jgi:hypothetical protein